jgi:hypothetical protein
MTLQDELFEIIQNGSIQQLEKFLNNLPQDFNFNIINASEEDPLSLAISTANSIKIRVLAQHIIISRNENFISDYQNNLFISDPFINAINSDRLYIVEEVFYILKKLNISINQNHFIEGTSHSAENIRKYFFSSFEVSNTLFYTVNNHVDLKKFEEVVIAGNVKAAKKIIDLPNIDLNYVDINDYTIMTTILQNTRNEEFFNLLINKPNLKIYHQDLAAGITHNLSLFYQLLRKYLYSNKRNDEEFEDLAHDGVVLLILSSSDNLGGTVSITLNEYGNLHFLSTEKTYYFAQRNMALYNINKAFLSKIENEQANNIKTALINNMMPENEVEKFILNFLFYNSEMANLFDRNPTPLEMEIYNSQLFRTKYSNKVQKIIDQVTLEFHVKQNQKSRTPEIAKELFIKNFIIFRFR